MFSFAVKVQQNIDIVMDNTLTSVLSSTEYIQYQPNDGLRYDFHNGELIALSPESDRHEQQVKRVADALETESGLRRCTVFHTHTKIETQADKTYLHADVSVTCNFLEFKSGNPVMRQPRMLAEVVTADTRERDRGFKWQQYQQVISLWYCLFVDPDTRSIDVYSKDTASGAWHCRTYRQPEERIPFDRFEMEIPVKNFFV